MARRRFSTATGAAVSTRVSAAIWGVTVTRGWDQKGWSGGSGSARNTSKRARKARAWARGSRLRAIGTVLSGRKISFPVTPKDRQEGRHLRLVRPQIAVVALTLASLLWGSAALVWADTGHSVTGVVTNALWGLNNCLAMAGIIRAATWTPEAEPTGDHDA